MRKGQACTDRMPNGAGRKKFCSNPTCDKRLPRGKKSRYCRPCRAEYQRQWRENNKEQEFQIGLSAGMSMDK